MQKSILINAMEVNETFFIAAKTSEKLKQGSVTWQAPSNIALVKYWGKKAHQIPANPSLSFTLNSCKSITTLAYDYKKNPSKEITFSIFLDGKKEESFTPKIATFFKRIEAYVPFLKNYSLVIHTKNTFPHSSGIASSASGMSALALGIMSMEKSLFPEITTSYFNKKASFLARLGSGSASRSIEGEVVVWGKHIAIPNSSNLYGIKFPFTLHQNFNNYQNTILLVDKGEKEVSSSVGHNLMHQHPYAAQRFIQANENLTQLTEILQNGNLESFIQIVESEALTLHAMMQTSMPYFILMHPNTLKIIKAIWQFRKASNIPICFTLDAGANVHVLYPEQYTQQCLSFITTKLLAFCQNENYICDTLGLGASKMEPTT